MAASQPAYEVDHLFQTTHDHLFDQPGPPLNILGKKSALDELQKGIVTNGFIVRLDQPEHASTAFEQSLDLLRQRDAFPDDEALLKLTAQSPDMQMIGGISPDDWVVKETVMYAVYPPFYFTQLNVDFLLAFLRVAQVYHNQDRVYQLVVVTKTYPEYYHVDLFRTVKDREPTHSIYLYRSLRLVGEGTTGALVIEQWRGFGLRPGRELEAPEVVPPPVYPRDLLRRVKRLRGRQTALQD